MASRYWVGGTGNWSDATNHWAITSGGSPGVANTPTHLDNVIFDTLSSAIAYTVTMDKEAFCADMTWGNPLVGAPTWAGSAAFNIYGSLSLVSGMTRTYSGSTTFRATSTGKTITLNTVATGGFMIFDGIGGGWTLQDNWNNGSSLFGIVAGTFDTNGKTITTNGSFNSSGVGIRGLILGSSIINCANWGTNPSYNLTFNAGTSSIRLNTSGFNGGGLTYYDVQLNGSAHSIFNKNTFTNLTRNGTATKIDSITLGEDQTITGTLTLIGNSATNRLLVQSYSKGTPRTLTAGTVVCSNVDFQDIVGAGAGSWNLASITGGSGDCCGNSGITLTTGANQYFKAGTSQNWSTSGNWYLATNGGGGAGRVPLPQDTAIFDTNSITAGSVVITQDMPRIGGVNWTGATNTPTWTTSTACSVFGSMTLISGMTLTASSPTYIFEGRGIYYLTSAGKDFGFKIVSIDAPNGSLIIQDTFVATGGQLDIKHGSLDTNNQTITVGTFQDANNGFIRSISLGSSIINCGGSFSMGSVITGLTFSAGTSSIRLTSGNLNNVSGITFYEVQLNGTAHTIGGSASFTTLTRTGTATKTDSLTLAGDQTITGTLTMAGNSATNRIIVQSSVKGTARTITAGTVTCSNIDIQDIIGGGAGSWNLSAITGNSGDCGGNSNITFTSPVTTNWQSGATWSTATWSSRVPLPQDTATFTTAGTATITQDMPRIGSVDFSTSANKTWTTSTTASIFGSIDLTNLTTLTGNTQTYTFEGRSSYTLKSASKTWAKPMIISMPNGTLTLQDTLNLGFSNSITLNNGTFNANNNNITTAAFISNNSNIRTVTMGSGIWDLLTWNLTTSQNITLNPDTSTVKFTNSSGNSSFIGGGLTYYNIWNATTGTGVSIVSGNNTFNDFKIDAGRTQIFTVFTIQTVNTFTAVGTVGNVITLNSTTAGSRAYIKDASGTNTCDYLSIQDIGVTGGATWVAGTNSTYVSGNIGWSTNPATDRYWVSGGNGYWDSTTNWSTSSGGTSGASVPIGENVFFDANSGASDIFITASTFMNNLDCTGFVGTFIGGSKNVIYGNMILVSSMTLLSTGSITFRVNNSSKTITTGTKTILGGITIDTIIDTVTMQDATTSNSSFTHTSGTIDFNNLNHSFASLSSTNTNTRTITMGSGTFTLSANGAIWNTSTITGLTLNQNTSTIKITDSSSQTKTFSGGGETFNNIWMTGAGSGSFNFTGSNTFNDFKVDTPPHTINFTAGTITTVNTFTVSGTAGNLMTIGSITAAQHTLMNAGGGTIASTYLSISNSNATPGSTWAASNSNDGGNNTGWIFGSLDPTLYPAFLLQMI